MFLDTYVLNLNVGTPGANHCVADDIRNFRDCSMTNHMWTCADSMRISAGWRLLG